MNALMTDPTLADAATPCPDVVARLQASEIFRDYQQAFQTATGLPVALRAAGASDARLLASFAQHLSFMANELMIKCTTAEAPAVTRARAFIVEHLSEDLSLGQVARAAGMSPFHFCKVFKAATGVTFTDYVARARVEKTKQMLLNPNVRVSEAAYAAGFQSLSQFNRVFRRVEGQAPTAYRQQLHGANAERTPLAFAA